MILWRRSTRGAARQSRAPCAAENHGRRRLEPGDAAVLRETLDRCRLKIEIKLTRARPAPYAGTRGHGGRTQGSEECAPKESTQVGVAVPIIRHDGQALYLVRETKGTRDFLKLRTSEADKVRCGLKPFEALGMPFAVAMTGDKV
jgi:hypothetical protein